MIEYFQNYLRLSMTSFFCFFNIFFRWFVCLKKRVDLFLSSSFKIDVLHESRESIVWVVFYLLDSILWIDDNTPDLLLHVRLLWLQSMLYRLFSDFTFTINNPRVLCILIFHPYVMLFDWPARETIDFNSLLVEAKCPLAGLQYFLGLVITWVRYQHSI